MRLVRLIVAAMVLLGVAGCGNNGPAGWVDTTAPTGVHIIATAGDGREIQGMAQDGDAVLLAREGRGALTVTRLSLKNGATSTVLRGDGRLSVLSMHGSTSIVGLTVTDADDEEGGYRSGLYVGPPTGPLRLRIPIRDAGWIPRAVHAEGDRLYVLQVRGEDERVVAFDLAGHSRLTPLRSLTINGEFEARTEELSACPGTPRASAHACVTVRRLGGGRVTATPIGRGEASAVSPTGRVVVRESEGGVVEVDRDGRLRRLLPNDEPPPYSQLAFYAGEHVLLSHSERAFGPEQMLLATPGRRPRRFGVPSEEPGPIRVDARRVMWVSNGCLLVADVRAPAATALPEGPCLRTQIAVQTEENPDRLRLRSDDRVPVRFECIAAPPPGCRGTLHLTGRRGKSRPQSVVVAPGQTRRIPVRLSARAVRAIRAADLGARYFVHVVSRDPDGRTEQWEGELALFG